MNEDAEVQLEQNFIDAKNALIELQKRKVEAEAIARLIKTDDFKLFRKRFVDDFLNTSVLNSYNYKEESDKRFLVAHKARSAFVLFIEEHTTMANSIDSDIGELTDFLKENGRE